MVIYINILERQRVIEQERGRERDIDKERKGEKKEMETEREKKASLNTNFLYFGVHVPRALQIIKIPSYSILFEQ